MIKLLAVTAERQELNIIRQLFNEYQQELDENLCFQSFEEELKHPLKKYGPPSGIIYLAYFNDLPVGCIALMPLPSENGKKVCEMKRLYVRPEYRRHQVGRMLIEKLLEKAKEMEYDIMKLDTLQKLQTAIHLYKKYGFTETTSYYQNPLPQVVYMEKHLTDQGQ
jgi:putative acetyltransferase